MRFSYLLKTASLLAVTASLSGVSAGDKQGIPPKASGHGISHDKNPQANPHREPTTTPGEAGGFISRYPHIPHDLESLNTQVQSYPKEHAERLRELLSPLRALLEKGKDHRNAPPHRPSLWGYFSPKKPQKYSQEFLDRENFGAYKKVLEERISHLLGVPVVSDHRTSDESKELLEKTGVTLQFAENKEGVDRVKVQLFETMAFFQGVKELSERHFVTNPSHGDFDFLETIKVSCEEAIAYIRERFDLLVKINSALPMEEILRDTGAITPPAFPVKEILTAAGKKRRDERKRKEKDDEDFVRQIEQNMGDARRREGGRERVAQQEDQVREEERGAKGALDDEQDDPFNLPEWDRNAPGLNRSASVDSQAEYEEERRAQEEARKEEERGLAQRNRYNRFLKLGKRPPLRRTSSLGAFNHGDDSAIKRTPLKKAHSIGVINHAEGLIGLKDEDFSRNVDAKPTADFSDFDSDAGSKSSRRATPSPVEENLEEEFLPSPRRSSPRVETQINLHEARQDLEGVMQAYQKAMGALRELHQPMGEAGRKTLLEVEGNIRSFNSDYEMRVMQDLLAKVEGSPAGEGKEMALALMHQGMSTIEAFLAVLREYGQRYGSEPELGKNHGWPVVRDQKHKIEVQVPQQDVRLFRGNSISEEERGEVVYE